MFSARLAAFLVPSILLLAPAAFTQPEVISVTGSLSQGETLVVYGHGFGTKAPAAPVLFDRLTNVAAYQNLAEGDPIPTHATGCADCPWQKASSWNDAVRYSRQLPRYDRGAVYRVATRGRLQFRDLGDATPDRFYVNWWVRTSHDLSGERDAKLIRVCERPGESPGFIDWAPVLITWLPDADHNGMPEDATTFYGTWGGAAYSWTNLELRVDSSDRLDLGWGHVEVLTDNSINHQAEFWASEPLNHLASIGLDIRDPDTTEGIDFGFTDIYIDTTFARVMISDSPMAEPGSHCELQIPVTWTPHQIEVTVVLGSFSDHENLYLFIFDDEGRRSNQGYNLESDFGPPGEPGQQAIDEKP